MKKKLKDFVYGFMIFEHVKTLEKAMLMEEFGLMTAVIGDMLGVPFTPPIYKYRLIPYWLNLIRAWKKEMLREKELIEKIR